MSGQVLIVSSDLGFARPLVSLVEDVGGYQTALANNQAAALEAARHGNYGLVIVDVSPSDDQSRALCYELNRICENSYFLIVLPKNTTTCPAFPGLPVVDCLLRPFYPEDLLEAVRGALDPAPEDRPVQSQSNPSPERSCVTGETATVQPQSLPRDESQPFIFLRESADFSQLLESCVHASQAIGVLVVCGEQLSVSGGKLQQGVVDELSRFVMERLNNQGSGRKSDLVWYTRSSLVDDEYLLYVTKLVGAYYLALVYERDTSFGIVRRGARTLRQALMDAPEAVTPEQISPEEQPVISTPRSPEPSGVDENEIEEPVPPLFLFDEVPPPTPEGYQGFLPQHGEMQWPWELDELVDEEVDAAAGRSEHFAPPRTRSSERRAANAPRQEDIRAQEKKQSSAQVDVGVNGVGWLQEAAQTSPGFAASAAAQDGRSPLQINADSPVYHELYFTCVLAPRMPGHQLNGEMAANLSDWMRALALAFDWRLEHLLIRPNYLHWVAKVTPQISAKSLIRLVRRHTNQQIFKRFPQLARENPSEDFWAPGYLVMTGSNVLPSRTIAEFIAHVRRYQGASSSA